MWDLWWTKWHWGKLSPSTSVSPANFHLINYSTILSSIIWGWYNRYKWTWAHHNHNDRARISMWPCIYRLQLCTAQDLHSVCGQNWALTKCMVGGHLLLSTFPVYCVISEAALVYIGQLIPLPVCTLLCPKPVIFVTASPTLSCQAWRPGRDPYFSFNIQCGSRVT
jgi:hypothetical protein